MSIREDRLAYGLVGEFRGSDALLFAGSGRRFHEFAKVLRQAAEERKAARIHLDDRELFIPTRATKAVIDLSGGPSTAQIAACRDGTIEVVWSLSVEAALEIAEVVEALAESDRSGHQYLEQAGEIQIVVSLGEGYESILCASE